MITKSKFRFLLEAEDVLTTGHCKCKCSCRHDAGKLRRENLHLLPEGVDYFGYCDLVDGELALKEEYKMYKGRVVPCDYDPANDLPEFPKEQYYVPELPGK